MGTQGQVGVVLAVKQLTVIVADPAFNGEIPRGPRFSVLTAQTAKLTDVLRPGTSLFVIAAATELGLVAELVHEANSIHRLRALFVRADIDVSWFLPMLERAKLRTLRNMIVHSSPGLPERVLRAWANGGQDHLIADAAVVADRLLLRSCTLERYEIGFGEVSALAELPLATRSDFTLDPDGSFLHWEQGDIHIGLETLRYASDPAFRVQTDLRRFAFDRRFGEAVASLRADRGLRRSDIAGVSAREVARIESGNVFPRLETVGRLASAHGLDITAYLSAVAGVLL
jgi:hypothetical protein